jgi:hypothetical protein
MQIGIGKNRESIESFLWGALSILGVLAAMAILTIVYAAH